ncbi:MAG: tandem-95 repeat protein, partial [Methanosarcinales archaeon]|nr:tandem-95 repeat protein [Methanosarcinales archaeon]
DEIKERYWDSVPHTDVQGMVWWEHKFYYITRLKEPFEQEKGTIYWLDIGAKPVVDEWYWGWETSVRHWNDNAVRGWNDGSWWECLGTAPIDFEDLTLKTTYNVGNIFTTSGVPITVKQFQWSSGTWTSDGHTRVVNGGQAGGSGNEMNVNNVNLDFGFGAHVNDLSLLFGEYGGNLNIRVNGDFRNFGKFAEINGLTIGGVHVTVVDLGDSKGRLTLTGAIEQFAVGGQELLIDDVEFVKRVDMAFALMTETVTSRMDWGDAPDGVTAPGYPTLAANGGASHIIDPDVCLGRWVEADEDGQPSIGAIGDDIIDGTDDEDGVAIPPLRAGATTRIKVLASVNGYLNAWFDWNADGDWDDEGEYVISERPIPAGSSAHNIRVPYDAKPVGSYARFRFSTMPLTAVLPPLYAGRAPDGEVEDYRFHVRPAGPDHFEPNDDFTTAFDLGSLSQNRTGLGIHKSGEEDWFKWTALNDGPVNFNVTGNVTLELYDSDGNKLATTGPDKCIPWDVTADASYYVRVRAADSHMTVLDYGWLVKLLGDSDNYALLFSGGSTPGYNYNRYYNNIKEMYETLVDDYDVPPGNIWILYADGTDPAADQPGGVNSDMSYVAGGTTVMSGTRANLESVLTTTLPGLVDGNDHFLFYAFDHGSGTSNAPATTGEEALTGWSASTADNDLKDWLNQVGAGHATVVHTQCFAGGMLDDLLPVTSSTFGCAATNHYEGSWGDGFAGAFADALMSGYGNAYDAYVYAHDHDTYAITRGTYPDNGGTWIYGKEHPWAASTANFPIFAEEDNLLPQLKEDDMYRYPEFYIGPYPPCDPLRITHDMLIAQELFMYGAIGMGFRVEAVNSGSLTKNGEPVVPGKTMIRYGESVVWTPPAPVNSAEESGEADVFDAFTIRAADGATVSDNSATITISTDLAGELVAVDDIVEIDEDERDVIIDVLANDSGNGTLVVAGVGQPQRGVALLAEGQVSYTPGPNFYGSDQFTYSVIDSALNTGTATVTVMVRSVNDPPEAYDDHLTVVMDSVNNTIDVLVNDYDVDPDPLTALPGNSPAHGSVIPNADGIFSYTPDAGYTGSDSFTYLADDGTDQSMATVMITVVEDADSDWGDAPEFSSSMGGGYPTRAASGGASHTIGGPWLGTLAPDGEADGHLDSAAMGDDNNNIDDEDGVSIPSLRQGKTAAIEIVVGGGGGYVDAWIDWNGNHLWEHPQEQIHVGHLPDGTHTISVSVPDASITGQTFARFRISSDGGLTPEGSAPDGEVEDYEVQIQASQGYCGCGDLNCDGVVTAADAVIALEMASGSHPSDAAADVSGDGQVTSLDALMILQAAAGQIEIC